MDSFPIDGSTEINSIFSKFRQACSVSILLILFLSVIIVVVAVAVVFARKLLARSTHKTTHRSMNTLTRGTHNGLEKETYTRGVLPRSVSVGRSHALGTCYIQENFLFFFVCFMVHSGCVFFLSFFSRIRRKRNAPNRACRTPPVAAISLNFPLNFNIYLCIYIIYTYL